MTKLAMCLVALGWIAQVRAAWAGNPSDRERASSLFASARQHMADGDFLAASAELSESENLDPQVGTALNLAYCYERMGRTATAWSTWVEAAAAAAAKGQHARQDAALARASALQASLLHATITVTPQAAHDLVRLAIDRTPLAPTAWGLPVALDPGKHELLAVADGYQSWSHEFVVAPGVEPSLLVPELQPIVRGETRVSNSRGALWRATLWTAGATAVGATAVGGAFGLAYQSKRAAMKANCTAAGCNGMALDDLAAVKTDGLVADTMFAVAGAALIAGAVTAIFFRPDTKPATAWTPTAGPLPGGAGVGLNHDW